MNIGAFNLGNALGAAIGGAVIAFDLGSVEKIGCGRWNRTTDVRLMRPTFHH